MLHTACLACLISTLSGRNKKKQKNALEDVSRHKQNLSNLYSLDIYIMLALRGWEVVSSILYNVYGLFCLCLSHIVNLFQMDRGQNW
jgi:hypothetical protein